MRGVSLGYLGGSWWIYRLIERSRTLLVKSSVLGHQIRDISAGQKVPDAPTIVSSEFQGVAF
jgi:hypothetical protein